MAGEATVDSPGGISTIPPVAGEGSQTPPTPGKGLGAGTPIGGGPQVAPAGMPGAPQKAPPSPEEQAEEQLLERSTDTLINDLSDILNDSKEVLSKTKSEKLKIAFDKVENVVNSLLERGWSEETIKKLIRKTGMNPQEFFKTLINRLEKTNELETTNFLKDKVKSKEETLAPGTSSVIKEQQSGPTSEGSPTATPPPVGLSQTAQANLTDVDLENNILNKRGKIMQKKLMIQDGAVVEAPDEKKIAEVLSSLVLAIRNTKKAISDFEDRKLKYAGTIALKKAMEPEDEEDVEEDIGEGIDIKEDIEQDADFDKEQLLSGLDQIKDGISAIESAMGDVEEELGSDEEISPMDMGQADNLMEMAVATKTKAREIIKTALKSVEAISGKENKAKKKSKTDPKMEEAIMGGKHSEKLAAEDMDDKKDDKKDDKEDKKEASEETKSLIEKVKAKLAELRDKEANLYPFRTDLHSKTEKVDNINETTAKQQASTANSEIKKQPVQDKDVETINPEIGQKDLPYKQEGQNTKDTKQSMPSRKMSSEEIEKIYKDAEEEASAKAKLSVELASQQMLKGLIENPLKEAIVKNMVEAGVDEEAAGDIAHNAYIDGYEKSQKVIMKEAFDTFMKKSYDDFVKVADFTDKYIMKEASELEPVEAEGREKVASEGAPLRGSKVDNNRGTDYKKYWEQVRRERRGF